MRRIVLACVPHVHALRHRGIDEADLKATEDLVREELGILVLHNGPWFRLTLVVGQRWIADRGPQ